MFSKSSSYALLLLASFACVRASLPPFDLIDDYVKNFQDRLNDLSKLSEEYRYSRDIQHLDKDAEEEKEVDDVHKLADAPEYDFIVIGSGTSGSVVASRLSEEPSWKILVLEAGGAENAVTQVPSLYPQIKNTPYTWGYWTVPQNTTCQAMEEQKFLYRKGKALGGDSVVNDMLYTRGHPKDYDTWADTGVKGWCWHSLEPYFKKIESACLKEMDKQYRQYGGPIHLEHFRYPTAVGDHLWQSCHGIYKQIDYNGKERLGFGKPQVIAKDGKRHSIAKAYFDRAFERENLFVSINSNVIKIIVGEHTKEAVGVKYVKDGKLHWAKANKEIILAAGAINTPHVLLLSGIGPKEELESVGINVLTDSKVGRNLQDHVSFTLDFSYNATEDPFLYHTDNDVVNYLKLGTGPLVTNGLELVGFVKTTKSRGTSNYPDIELLVRREHYKPSCSYWNVVNVRAEFVNDHLCDIRDKLSFEVILLHPKSKGYIKLVNSNPFNPPILNPNGLSDAGDEDIDTLIAGIHEALKFIDTERMQQIGLQLELDKFASCDPDLKNVNDEFWKCAIRHWASYTGDIVGTAKMGNEHDKEAVVDHELRVYGIQKLRIADSSVIPLSLSGNIMAPQIVIGEKAAHLLKETWLN